MSSRIMSYNINKNERQQQQQQLPTTNAYNLPKDVSKLDLHGYNKSEGIRRTTDFLDRIASKSKQNSTKAWALVVTGSGAHSSHSQGPVLRGAIENLLIKRNIEYYPMKGNGSFLVNALSGFVLYEPEQPRDTKVIISANANNAKNNHPSASYSSAVASMAAIKPLSLKQQIDNTNNGVALKKAYNKQRKEELAYQRAMSQSLADPTYRAEKQEEESLERAFNLSILEKRRELQEEQKIQKIIEDSRRESRIQAMAELDEIQKVAELSIREFEQAMADEEDEIQKVAESSKREFDNNDNNAHNNNHNNNMRGSRKEAMMAEEEDDDDDDDEYNHDDDDDDDDEYNYEDEDKFDIEAREINKIITATRMIENTAAKTDSRHTSTTATATRTDPSPPAPITATTRTTTSPTTTKETRRKKIRWSGRVRVHEIRHINNIPDDERELIWMSPIDYTMIKVMAKTTVYKMMSGEHINDDNPDFCTRGLEFRTRSGSRIRNANKMRNRSAVLNEQDLQHEEGFYDPEFIAMASMDESFICREAARNRAENDTKSIQSYIDDVRDIVWGLRPLSGRNSKYYLYE